MVMSTYSILRNAIVETVGKQGNVKTDKNTINTYGNLHVQIHIIHISYQATIPNINKNGLSVHISCTFYFV